MQEATKQPSCIFDNAVDNPTLVAITTTTQDKAEVLSVVCFADDIVAVDKCHHTLTKMHPSHPIETPAHTTLHTNAAKPRSLTSHFHHVEANGWICHSSNHCSSCCLCRRSTVACPPHGHKKADTLFPEPQTKQPPSKSQRDQQGHGGN